MRGDFMLLTEQQLCDKLQIDRVLLWKCRKNGLPYLRIGTKIIRYDYEEVLKWFEENEQQAI